MYDIACTKLVISPTCNGFPLLKNACIMGSHNFKGTTSSVFGIHCWLQCNMYIAVQYIYCTAIYKGRSFGAWLPALQVGHMMVCGLPSRKKNRRGRVKMRGLPYQRHSGMFFAHSLY